LQSKIRAPFGLVIGLASIEARESLRKYLILPEVTIPPLSFVFSGVYLDST